MKALILIWRAIATIALATLIAPFVWETVSGDYYMIVNGKSMSPTYEIGDVLSVQKPQGDELQTDGNIVVVAFTPGDKATQYVHRVLDHTTDSATLKGDGNETADPSPVTQDLVMGAPRFAMQGPLADAFRFLSSWGGRILIAVLMVPAFIVSIPTRRGNNRNTNSPTSALKAGAA